MNFRQEHKMNETKILIYVPFHEIKGFDWAAMTTEYSEMTPRTTGYEWYQILVDGDNKQPIMMLDKNGNRSIFDDIDQ